MNAEAGEKGIISMAGSFLLQAKVFFLKRPLLLLLLAPVLVLFYFFWHVFLAMFIIIAVFLLVVKLVYSQPSAKELLEKKSMLQEELKIAESKLLQHKIDLKDYQELSDQAQKQLVGIEAKLSESAFRREAKKESKSVSSKNRHLLKSLLEEKKTIEEETRIAEIKYFKRKINSATYQQILKEKQVQLIKLEAGIKNVFAEESVEQIKKDLAEKLKYLEESEEKKQKRYAESVTEDIVWQQEKND